MTFHSTAKHKFYTEGKQVSCLAYWRFLLLIVSNPPRYFTAPLATIDLLFIRNFKQSLTLAFVFKQLVKTIVLFYLNLIYYLSSINIPRRKKNIYIKILNKTDIILDKICVVPLKDGISCKKLFTKEICLSYQTFYTLGRCKIKCLNCWFNN